MKNTKNKTTKTDKMTKKIKAILVNNIDEKKIFKFIVNVYIMLSNVITTTIYTAFDELKFEMEYFGYSKLNRFSIKRVVED